MAHEGRPLVAKLGLIERIDKGARMAALRPFVVDRGVARPALLRG